MTDVTTALEPFRRYLTDALEYGGNTHTLEDVAAKIASGDAQFWPGVEAFIITEIVDFPLRRECHVWLAGGNLAEIEAMVVPLEAWARSVGCTHATLTGRRGWARTFLARTGWAPTLEVLEKAL